MVRKKEFFNNPDYSDVTIVGGDDSFVAAKIILACHSAYFRSLFSGSFNDSKAKQVELKGNFRGSVKDIVLWMYLTEDKNRNDKMQLLEKSFGTDSESPSYALAGLIIAADKYQVLGLRAEALRYLIGRLDPSKHHSSNTSALETLAILPGAAIHPHLKHLFVTLGKELLQYTHFHRESLQLVFDAHPTIETSLREGVIYDSWNNMEKGGPRVCDTCPRARYEKSCNVCGKEMSTKCQRNKPTTSQMEQ